MSGMRIKTSVIGLVSTNCYLVYREGTKAAVIVDPADNGDFIIKLCGDLGVRPEGILLTHGHFDHIMAVEDLRTQYGCPVYAGVDEMALLGDPSLNMSGAYGLPEAAFAADRWLQDGEEWELIGFRWRVLATPGHTAGSVCFYVADEAVVFSGDTLFQESLGRTDLPTGDTGQIVRSIKEKLLVLPEDTMVYPGHGEPTTIAHEKVYNPVAMYRG